MFERSLKRALLYARAKLAQAFTRAILRTSRWYILGLLASKTRSWEGRMINRLKKITHTLVSPFKMCSL